MMASESERSQSIERIARVRVGSGPRKGDYFPWDPGKPPGGKIPEDKRRSNQNTDLANEEAALSD